MHIPTLARDLALNQARTATQRPVNKIYRRNQDIYSWNRPVGQGLRMWKRAGR